MPREKKTTCRFVFFSFPLLALLLSSFLLFAPTKTMAAIEMTMQVPIGSFSGKISVGPDTIGKYIKNIYDYLIGSVGIIATVILMYAGILWITAAGNPGQVTEAKAWISAAMTGLVLALFSYVILYWVNPDLLQFKSLAITEITATQSQNVATDCTKYFCCGSNGRENTILKNGQCACEASLGQVCSSSDYECVQDGNMWVCKNTSVFD